MANDIVTIRFRDDMQQIQVPIAQVAGRLRSYLDSDVPTAEVKHAEPAENGPKNA